MGRHVKVGKQRKDKYYKLAKETGFRSRAAFKLLQLNRKFEFLQRSRVLIDLCAAPGGWLQVAEKSMPVSSLIIGVDLVPIKPIPNVIGLQEDITTEKCRQALKKQLKTWKADAVLHDGAPNVGKSWLHDAFAQAELTLSALKLATEFLTPGGWFVTKVFRSKDYNSLLWVFGKLFKKVHVTKPQASRNESAEIFVACQGYIAPDRIDPKFLDPAHVFKDVEPLKTAKPNPLQFSKKKPKAEGYEDGDLSVMRKLKASDFIFGDNHLEKFIESTEIIFDMDDLRDHRLTTPDVKESCKDLKVLGKAEIRVLLNWRKKLREILKEQEKKENAEERTLDNVVEEGNGEEDDIEDAENEAKNLELSKYQELKRKKKKLLKEARKVHEKINLKMIIKDDVPVIEEDIELFNIMQLKSMKDLTKLEDADPDKEHSSEDEDKKDEEEEQFINNYRKNYITYDRHQEQETWCDVGDEKKEKKTKIHEYESDSSEDEGEDFDVSHQLSDEEMQMESETEETPENPLLVDIVSKDEKTQETVSQWYDKDDFADVSEDDELDLELLAENAASNKANTKTLGPKSAKEGKKIVGKGKKSVKFAAGVENNGSVSLDSDDDDVDSDKEEKDEETSVTENKPKRKRKKRVMLDPEGLALGAMMIRSKKTKRDIIDNSYNRYASNDENLPDWFVQDEMKHNKKQIPVTQEMVQEYKDQLRVINARPIKKVVEAKARKKRRAMRRLEKARKRAETITDNLDMSEKEKTEQLRTIYKKAVAKKDTSVTYVFAKKGTGRRAHRPAGLKGRYRVVDKRMKKDDRRRKTELKSGKKARRPPQMKKKRNK